MRSPPRLLLSAALIGAVTGAAMAWRIVGSPTPQAGPTNRIPQTTEPLAVRVQAPASDQAPPAQVPEATQAVDSPSPSPSAVPTLEDRSSAQSRDDAAFSAVAWDGVTDPVATEQQCVTGDARACLALADYEERARDLNKSRQHRERAYAILVPKCHHRDPDACVLIARMQAFGLGIARDPASTRALLERATILCKSRPGKSCSALNP